MIDANPAWFRTLSGRMAEDARQLTAAATARDPMRTRDLAENLTTSCQTCHTLYWETRAGRR